MTRAAIESRESVSLSRLFLRVTDQMKNGELPRRRHRTSDEEVRLTRRERQIVALLLEGYANKEIAARLNVSDQTVKNQLSTLYRKTGVSSRLELVLLAQEKQL